MPIFKLQTSLWADSVLPRDSFTITPHFRINGALSDPDALCEDLADAMAQWSGNTHQVEVKAYDAEGTKPVYPAGTAIRNVGSAAASTMPREVALCLSYYADRNAPRHRGRLYLPGPLLGATAGLRPTTAQQEKVMNLVDTFIDLGGANVDWVVWSRMDATARAVGGWWIDNEWDTVRSRGLRATDRIGTTVAHP